LCWAYGFVPRRYMPVMRSCRGSGPSSHGCRGCAKKAARDRKMTEHTEPLHAKRASLNPDRLTALRGSEDLTSITFGVGPV
jgi:hypothetical protein